MKFWLRPACAGLLLALFYAVLLVSVRRKSVTADEIVHVTSGYTYWTFNDYRLNPENGNLPQRLMALPLLGTRFPFPARTSAAWRGGDEWELGDQWFHRMGNDVSDLLARGRAASALLAVALAALVWFYARRLFGPEGGLLSLLLCILSPMILANGPLMTSDIACCLFFLAATMTIWDLLHRLSPGRLGLAGLALAGLFLSKMSAPLILPIAIILVAVRLIEGSPWPLEWRRWGRMLAGRGRLAAGFAAAAAALVLFVWASIWAAFGFRYSAFADAPHSSHFNDTWEHLTDRPLLPAALAGLQLDPGRARAVKQRMIAEGVPANKWTTEAVAFAAEIERDILTPQQAARLQAELSAPPPGFLPRVLDVIHRDHLLPEAYTFGQAYSWKFAQKRGAFFNGQYGLFGWRTFFPYTFLVKTPLAVFGVFILALAAANWRWRRFYPVWPLWTLLAVYGAALISSHINIGARHFLTVYPPAFILAGCAAGIGGWGRRVLAALVVLLAAEVAFHFPNYIAYFNVIAGGSDHAYRHLVDSSLDWGQDLPAVNPYLDEHHITGPVYLSYFGTASPTYYHVRAKLLYSLEKPMQYFTFPVAEAPVKVPELLQAHPDFQTAASGSSGGNVGVMLLERPAAFRLDPGTYLISATMVQALEHNPPGPWGPWNERYEREYQNLKTVAAPFLRDNAAARQAALAEGSVYDWMKVLNDYDEYRFARLTAYLRSREADDTINSSILVYHLTAADLAKALDGPPPERGPDVLRDLERAMGSKSVNQP